MRKYKVYTNLSNIISMLSSDFSSIIQKDYSSHNFQYTSIFEI